MSLFRWSLMSGGLCLALSASAVELNSDGVRCLLHRPAEKQQSMTASADPSGRPAMEIQWDGAKAKYAEFALNPAPVLPQFKTLEVTAEVFLPENPGNRNFNIRLIDATGEVFQYSTSVAPEEQGARAYTYRIDAATPAKGSWGGNRDGKFDWPVRLGGAAFDFRNANSGKLWVKSLTGKVISDGSSRHGIIDFAVTRPSIALHRPEEKAQRYRYEAMPDGKPALRIDWDNAKAAHVEFIIGQKLTLPEFTRARVRVNAYLPADCHARSLNLRLTDADGEVFQFGRPVPAGAQGWQEFCYEIDAAKPAGGSWNGGAKANKKLDFPVVLTGFAADFKSRSGEGWLGIGEVKLDVVSGGVSLAPQLETGNPIHVVVPGQEEKLGIRVVNPRDAEVRGELAYRVCDVDGRELAARQETVTVPAGSDAFVSLPAPTGYGVYSVISTFRDLDGDSKPAERTMSYSYMLPAGPTPGPATGFLFGVCSHPQGKSVAEQELEAMAAGWCGAKVVREDIGWGRMQPAADRWSFESFDRTVEIFGRYGIELEAIYSYVPDWAVAKDWQPVSTRYPGKKRPDYRHWAKFIRTFAERYRDKVRYVEVWNEPDLIGFANFTAAEYLELMKIAYRETKAAAPEMIVLTGGFTCMPGMHGKMNDPEHMIKTIRDGKGFYDVHAFHGHGPFSSYQPQIDDLVKLRESLGVTAPWYANETAISSIHIGERVQAVTLFQKFLYSWARGAMGYNWYDLRNDGFDPGENEHNFGLITKDFYPKAAYGVYNALATFYRDGAFLHDLDLGAQLYGLLFRAKDGALLLAKWNGDNGGGSRLVILGGVTGKAAEIDLFGNTAERTAHQGLLVTEVGTTPGSLRLEQSAEPRVVGELLRATGELVIAAGGRANLTYDLENPTDAPLTFRFQVALPAGLTTPELTPAITVPAQGRAKLQLPIQAAPEFRSFYGQLKSLALTVDAGVLWQGTIQSRIQTVTTLAAGEFRSVPDFTLASVSQLKMLAPNAPEKAHLFWKGAEDLSAKVWLGRRQEFLQLKVEVRDDTHCQPFDGGGVWGGDNIQFALQLPGQSGYWELGLTRLSDGRSEVFCWTAPRGYDAAATAAKIRLTTTRDEGTGTTGYLAELPLQAIGLTPEIGRRGFRFNLLVNDNDGEMRESFLSIAPGIGESKNPARYPVINFQE